MRSSQLRSARNHLSELVRQSRSDGPQTITVRGEPTVVVMAQADYERLASPRQSFVEFMRSSPLVGIELDIRRDRLRTRSTRTRRES